MILGVDPGFEQTAVVVLDGRAVAMHLTLRNSETVEVLQDIRRDGWRGMEMAIEMVASYGMPVGKEVFDTCVWIGRFVQAWGHPARLVYRREVKLHLCGRANAKDPNVRQALIDRYGPGKAAAIGIKSKPGPLYGIRQDEWSALAVAVTAAETREGR